MDSERIESRNFRIIGVIVLVTGLLLGTFLTVTGFLSVRDAKERVGTESVEEINEKMRELSVEYNKYHDLFLEELEEDPESEKISEIRSQEEKVRNEILELTRKRYDKETGYNNPRNFGEMLSFAPTIWVGAIVVIIGIVIASILVALGRRR